MSAAALLSRNPHPDESQIRSALSGHICRCGAYGRILRAVKDRRGAVWAKEGRPTMSVIDALSDAALTVTGPPRWAEEPALRASSGSEAKLLLMDRQGGVIALSGKVEYGQGIRSGFALAIADELDVPVDSVRVILGDTRSVPYDRGTTGSASTRTVGLQLRRAAATARQALIALASERWSVAAERLATSASHVLSGDEPSRKISYAKLLEGQKLTVHIPENTTLKSPHGFLSWAVTLSGQMLSPVSRGRPSTHRTSLCPACFTVRSSTHLPTELAYRK